MEVTFKFHQDSESDLAYLGVIYEPKCWDWSMRLEYLNLGKKIAINVM